MPPAKPSAMVFGCVCVAERFCPCLQGFIHYWRSLRLDADDLHVWVLGFLLLCLCPRLIRPRQQAPTPHQPLAGLQEFPAQPCHAQQQHTASLYGETYSRPSVCESSLAFFSASGKVSPKSSRSAPYCLNAIHLNFGRVNGNNDFC